MDSSVCLSAPLIWVLHPFRVLCEKGGGSASAGTDRGAPPPLVALLILASPSRLSAFFLPRIKPLHLRTVPAARHVAPAAVMVLAGIQKKPLAHFRGAGPNVGQLIRSQQIGSRTGDGP